MELSRKKWYVRLFFWSLDIWSEFKDESSHQNYGQRMGTNLCFFMRVILVYMPVVLLLHAAILISLVASLTVVPIYFFGALKFFLILVAFLFVIGSVLLIKAYRRRFVPREFSLIMDQFTIPEELLINQTTKKTNSIGFFKVLKEYIIATKMKICPSIQFDPRRED